MDTLVVGVDAGATTTRCVVANLDGAVVARGSAGGANQNSSGRDLTSVLATALEAASDYRHDVRIGVLGAAGSSGAGREGFRSAAAAAWQRAGLSGEVITVTDLEAGYAAGTAAPDGVLLLSGTGALAARFADGVLERRVDGYGWLAGDEGSAVWIGIRALRAALAALDGRGEPTALVEAAAEALGVALPPEREVALPHPEVAAHPDAEVAALPHREAERSASLEGSGPGGGNEDLAQRLLAAGFAVAPAELGRIAPAVSAAAENDAVAQRICAAAAAKLLHKFAVLEPRRGTGVVLAGSVLLSPGPIARAVRAGVRARTGVDPSEATDGATGGAALAIARLTGAAVSAEVHAQLTGGAPAG